MSYNDTSSEAAAILNDLLQLAPVWRKMKALGQLNATAQLLVLNELRERHPEARVLNSRDCWLTAYWARSWRRPSMVRLHAVRKERADVARTDRFHMTSREDLRGTGYG